MTTRASIGVSLDPSSGPSEGSTLCLTNTLVRRLASLAMAALACVAIYFCISHLASEQRILADLMGLAYGVAAVGNLLYAFVGCDEPETESKGDLFYYTPKKAISQFFLTLFAPIVVAGSFVGVPIYIAYHCRSAIQKT